MIKPVEEEAPTRSSSRISLGSPTSSSTSSSVYGDNCNFCGKNRVQYKGKKVSPITIPTKIAEETIQKAAKLANDNLYIQICDQDLIAKEFKYHRHCYRAYTRDVSTKSSSDKNLKYDKGNIKALNDFINTEMLNKGKIFPVAKLQEVYGISIEDKRYAYYVKNIVRDKFKDEVTFLTSTAPKKCEYAIGTNTLNDDLFKRNNIIKEAAEYIRKDVTSMAKSVDDLPWPPTAEQLSSDQRKPPESILLFLQTLLKSCTNEITPLLDSFAQDLIYSITKGKFLTEKHLLMALGMHNLTGQKKVVQLLHKFGHCIPYHLTCDILSAYAESTIEQSKMSSILPLKPPTSEETVFTHFWVDNFDIQTDTKLGGGSINMTTLMAFQEGSKEDVEIMHIPIERKSSRQIPSIGNTNLLNNTAKFDQYATPPKNDSIEATVFHIKDDTFNLSYLSWILLRNTHRLHQIVPLYSAHKMKTRLLEHGEVNKTIETYLPPIETKVNHLF